MGLIIRILFTFTCVITIVAQSYAGWQGPAEIINGIWGSRVAQFGLEQGDSGDEFPEIEAIIPDGKIVISDTVNKKQLVFTNDGNFIKEVKWMLKAQSGGRTTYSVPEFSYGSVLGYTGDGNIYTSSGNNFFLKSPSGQLIKTMTTKPLELGVVKTETRGSGNYRITITYPDKTFVLTSDSYFEKYVRDNRGYVYGLNSGGIWKFNQCGKEIAELIIPTEEKEAITAKNAPDQSIAFDVEYGQPVVSPNGDVYTWRKSPNKYSVVKWTWVDEPNVSTGPDAPTGLSLMPSTTGIYLTWTASPQDLSAVTPAQAGPGCVTGYEIARATTSGGAFSTVGTVDKGVVKYNDTTASTGTTYYYKVRAKAGTEYSPYTNEVSGKR